jgi:predicted Zn finger-like uncharacterized protein
LAKPKIRFAMLLSCPNCATSYEVDRTSLGSTGRSVRCLRCRHIWFASNATAFADIANAHRADVAALAGVTTVAAAPSPPAEPPIPYYTNVLPSPPPAAIDAEPISDASAAYVDAPAAEDPIAPPLAPEMADAKDFASAPDATAVTPIDDLAVASADAAMLAPADDVAPPQSAHERAHDRTVGADIETVAARRTARAAKRRRTRSLQGLTTAILVLVAIITGLVAWRSDVVR